ncbi:MAG TPA: hypothetical protein VFQ44_26950 [Streptosporangiaceae bacterium]|nr:hypothetical protein [Streptosporangiaceae bacterium]
MAVAASGGSPAALAAPSQQSRVLTPESGTSIGNAGQLTTSGSGTIGNGSDDWWVIYPSTPGQTVSVTVHNNASANCGIQATLYGTNGASQFIDDAGLNSASTGTISGAAPASDRYFIEVTPNNCSASAPYSLTLTSGGGGTVPSPAAGSVSPGDGIGDVGAALKGHTLYNESITFNGGTEDWYVFYKRPDSQVASIRLSNITVNGATSCAVFTASLFTNRGTAANVTNVSLNNNDAGAIAVPARQAGDPQGQFYLRVTADGFDCGTGGANYTIEPEPSTEFISVAKIPTGKVTPAPSVGGPWPPLQGGISYQGSIDFNGGTENWYVLYKRPDSHVATVRIANTTVDGSTSCAVFFATLFSNAGTNGQLANTPLNNDAVTTLTVPAHQSGDPHGVFYLRIAADGFDCGSGGANYTIEPNPKAEFANPARPKTGKQAPASSLRRAWPPLSGGLAYKGSIDFSGGTQNWYVLDKKADRHPAAIQVTNTTTDGSTSCAVMTANLYTNKGPAVTLASISLGNNASATLSIPAHQAGDPQGLFYLQITADGFDCGTGGATYTLTATPATEFIRPALKVASLALKRGKLHKAYKTTIGVSEGKAPYTFIAKTKLPPGLALGKHTGVVSGKPAKRGSFKFTVEIEDSSKPHRKTVTDVFTITIW